MSAIRVQIERVKRTKVEAITLFVLRVGLAYFLSGLFLMLFLPLALHWHPGYWQCVGIAAVVRSLSPMDSSLDWTHFAPSKRARR